MTLTTAVFDLLSVIAILVGPIVLILALGAPMMFDCAKPDPAEPTTTV